MRTRRWGDPGYRSRITREFLPPEDRLRRLSYHEAGHAIAFVRLAAPDAILRCAVVNRAQLSGGLHVKFGRTGAAARITVFASAAAAEQRARFAPMKATTTPTTFGCCLTAIVNWSTVAASTLIG